mgnify:FL=1
MSEKHKELLSAFVDEDQNLTEFEKRLVVKKLTESRLERDKFSRYQLMSEAIKGRVSNFINPQFADNVSQRLHANKRGKTKRTLSGYMQLSFRKPGIMAVLAVICIFTLSALFVMNTKYMHKMFNLDANINIAKINDNNNLHPQIKNIDQADMQKNLVAHMHAKWKNALPTPKLFLPPVKLVGHARH